LLFSPKDTVRDSLLSIGKRMKRFLSLIIPSIILVACQTRGINPSATISSTTPEIPIEAFTPIPTVKIEMSQFDIDVSPPIQVLHTPPLIAKSREVVNLDFKFLCGYLGQIPNLDCILDAIL